MAFFDIKVFSKVLYSSVSLYVTLPIPDPDDPLNGLDNRYLEPGEKYQTLYLLHGAYADHSFWLRYSNIERYAQAKKLAVVMPAVGPKSMYMNGTYGKNYFDFYTEELPMIMQSIFPLSKKREDNFIAGLSMGGMGAFYAALSKPEKYAAAASLSGIIDTKFGTTVEDPRMAGVVGEDKNWDIFGENYRLYDPELHDLRTIAKRQAEAGKELPKLYIACGTDDFVYDQSISGRDYLKSLGYDVTYEEGPGGHVWDFWDKYIRKVVGEWLPLKGDVVKE